MKRFLLFMGEDHHPPGGWYDFRESYDTEEEARAAVQATPGSKMSYGGDWAHVVDSTTGGMVCIARSGYGNTQWTWTLLGEAIQQDSDDG